MPWLGINEDFAVLLGRRQNVQARNMEGNALICQGDHKMYCSPFTVHPSSLSCRDYRLISTDGVELLVLAKNSPPGFVARTVTVRDC